MTLKLDDKARQVAARIISNHERYSEHPFDSDIEQMLEQRATSPKASSDDPRRPRHDHPKAVR